MSKPREWWIIAPNTIYKNGIVSPEPIPSKHESITHVIEKSAADKLAEALEQVLSETDHPYLEQALKEYRGEE